MKHFFVLYNNYVKDLMLVLLGKIKSQDTTYYLDHDPGMPYPYQYR